MSLPSSNWVAPRMQRQPRLLTQTLHRAFRWLLDAVAPGSKQVSPTHIGASEVKAEMLAPAV